MFDQDVQELLSESKNPEEIGSRSSKIFKQWSNRANTWNPPTDVFENEKSIIVRIEIAGMSDSEFTLSIEENVLAIHGVRSAPNGERAYHRMEILSGEFVSIVELPSPIDYDRVDASYHDGFLLVVLPKV